MTSAVLPASWLHAVADFFKARLPMAMRRQNA
jgi:hypothetical protein